MAYMFIDIFLPSPVGPAKSHFLVWIINCPNIQNYYMPTGEKAELNTKRCWFVSLFTIYAAFPEPKTSMEKCVPDCLLLFHRFHPIHKHYINSTTFKSRHISNGNRMLCEEVVQKHNIFGYDTQDHPHSIC